MSLADAFDLLGVVLLALFAFSIWPPASLAVVGVAFLVAGRAANG